MTAAEATAGAGANNLVHAHAHAGSAQVRVFTRRFARQAVQVKRADLHVLTLFPARKTAGSRGCFAASHDHPFDVSFGDLIFVPAGATVTALGPGGERDLVACYFPAGRSRTLGEFEARGIDSLPPQLGDLRNETLAATMRRLRCELLSPGFGHDLLVEGLVATVEVELARTLTGVAARPAPARGGLTPLQLRRIEDHVRGDPGASLHAEDLAALLGLSRGHLMRAFKASTGETLRGFVERIRIAEARRLLAADDVPLAQIGARLGFRSQSLFSVAFRRACGTTPRDYRRSRS